ncbi:MAG: hypothetical protein MIO88_05305, partial [Methanoregulaceae archaeon]|nr:hypothetical protein [Methanoregulaceae archaeon]
RWHQYWQYSRQSNDGAVVRYTILKILHPDKKGIGSHRAALPIHDLFFCFNPLKTGNILFMRLFLNKGFSDL